MSYTPDHYLEGGGDVGTPFDDFEDDGLRQRRVVHPHATAVLRKQPSPPPPIIQTWRTRIYTYAADWSLWREETAQWYEERWEQRVRACQTYTWYVLVLMALVVLTVFVLSGASLLTSDQGAVIDSLAVWAVSPTYNYSQVARPLTCQELQQHTLHDNYSFAQLHTSLARGFAQEPDTPCACAPMVGVPVQHIVLRLPLGAAQRNDSLHMYNIEPIALRNISKALVTEAQRRLFPSHAETVQVIRNTTVRFVYRKDDDDCPLKAITVTGADAFCLQACYDLLHGKSVYDVAVESRV